MGKYEKSFFFVFVFVFGLVFRLFLEHLELWYQNFFFMDLSAGIPKYKTKFVFDKILEIVLGCFCFSFFCFSCLGLESFILKNKHFFFFWKNIDSLGLGLVMFILKDKKPFWNTRDFFRVIFFFRAWGEKVHLLVPSSLN